MKTSRYIREDNPSVTDTFESASPRVCLGYNGPSYIREDLYRASACKAQDAKRLSPSSAASVGLTDEELMFAADTEFSESAASQFVRAVGESTFARWQAEDAAERAAVEAEAVRRDAFFRVRELARHVSAIARAGQPELAASLNQLARQTVDEIDPQQADAALLAAGATLFELGISY